MHQYIPKCCDVYSAYNMITAHRIAAYSIRRGVYSKTYPRVTVLTIMFVVGNKTKASIDIWDLDIKTFMVAARKSPRSETSMHVVLRLCFGIVHLRSHCTANLLRNLTSSIFCHHWRSYQDIFSWKECSNKRPVYFLSLLVLQVHLQLHNFPCSSTKVNCSQMWTKLVRTQYFKKENLIDCSLHGRSVPGLPDFRDRLPCRLNWLMLDYLRHSFS